MSDSNLLPDRFVGVISYYIGPEDICTSDVGVYTELYLEVSPEWCDRGAIFLSKDTSLTPETLPLEGSVVVLELTNELPEEWFDYVNRLPSRSPDDIPNAHRLWRIVTG